MCEDLIIEIFSRLPAKSLLRFRSVSKSLCVLIGSPRFIQIHALRSPRQVLITHRVRRDNRVNSAKKVEYTLHSEGQLSDDDPYVGTQAVKIPLTDFYIFGSCNGIVCLYEEGKGNIYLWNPSIRRIVTVHDRPDWGDYWRVHGFGFDPIIGDYKILVINHDCCLVYTMKTRTWREIASPTSPGPFLLSDQCLFGGALHWVVLLDARHCYVLKFDLSSEVFSTIDLPQKALQVCQVKGCLAVISSQHKDDDAWPWRWVIWVRREHKNNTDASWSVAYKVDIHLHDYYNPRLHLQITPNGKLQSFSISEGIIVYNLETGFKKRVQDLSCLSCIVGVHMYFESLELLDMGTSYGGGGRGVLAAVVRVWRRWWRLLCGFLILLGVVWHLLR